MGKNKALILVAVVMVLASASTTYGYYERWTGWFSEGTLICSGYSYTRDGTGGAADDTTCSGSPPTRDTFYTPNSVHVGFVCSALNDTIYLTVSSLYGGKDTGRSGIKSGSGTWAGSAIRRKNTVEQTWNSLTGTWNTDTEGDGFDYTPLPDDPATYSLHWYVYSTLSLSGGGTSSGYCSDYDP
ncbi:hypothetical protein GX441_04340 [bacterium]|nr:hypothetical protein [bacterium]